MSKVYLKKVPKSNILGCKDLNGKVCYYASRGICSKFKVPGGCNIAFIRVEKTATWVEKYKDTCSNCGYCANVNLKYEYNFCPSCGMTINKGEN